MVDVFIVVYLAMAIGRLPGLALDRTGAALFGAIVLVASGRVVPTEAWAAIDVPTVALVLAACRLAARAWTTG